MLQVQKEKPRMTEKYMHLLLRNWPVSAIYTHVDFLQCFFALADFQLRT